MTKKNIKNNHNMPLNNPTPNFTKLRNILSGLERPERVHFVEFLVDEEVMQIILSELMNKPFPFKESNQIAQKKNNNFIKKGRKISALSEKEEMLLIKGYIDFYYLLGYDYVPDLRTNKLLVSMLNPFSRDAKDTAIIPKIYSTSSSVGNFESKRQWIEESKGIITCWKDFNDFQWDKINVDIDGYYNFMCENLPSGMKIIPFHGVYEGVADQLLGQQGLYYMLYDQPELVEAVINEWGKICYNFYKSTVKYECVGAICNGDDLGYRNGTMISPEWIRKLLIPWYKKFSVLAHESNRSFWVHCCGNVKEIMKDFIEVVKIDAFHSFQDIIIPVADFQEKYGDSIGVMGGVDVDKMARFEENDLRKYIRIILDKCMEKGRYALGSGNSITNYIPIENYLIMLEEGQRWRV